MGVGKQDDGKVIASRWDTDRTYALQIKRIADLIRSNDPKNFRKAVQTMVQLQLSKVERQELDERIRIYLDDDADRSQFEEAMNELNALHPVKPN